jgi:hypothetical protein
MVQTGVNRGRENSDKDEDEPETRLNNSIVPRSKHTPPRLKRIRFCTGNNRCLF